MKIAKIVQKISSYVTLNIVLRCEDHKYLVSLEMECCRRMEKIRWTDHVRKEEVLHGVTERRGEEYPANNKTREG
jgi:hypothetical protein